MNVPVCPAWCDTDHGAAQTTDGLLCHYRPTGTVGGARVDVVVTDDLNAGTRGAVGVDVACDDVLSPADARALALALLDAIDLAGGAL